MGSTASAPSRRFRAPKDNAEKSTSAARNNVDVLHCRCCALPMDYISRWQYLTASACRHISPYARPAPRNRQTPGAHRAEISIKSTTSSCAGDVCHPEPPRQPATAHRTAIPPHTRPAPRTRLPPTPRTARQTHRASGTCASPCRPEPRPVVANYRASPPPLPTAPLTSGSLAAFACGDNLLSGLPITRYSEALILWCRR